MGKVVKYRLFERIHANSYDFVKIRKKIRTNSYEFRNFVRKTTNSYEKLRKMMKFFVFSICPFFVAEKWYFYFCVFLYEFCRFSQKFVNFIRIRTNSYEVLRIRNTKNYEILRKFTNSYEFVRIRTKKAWLNGQVHPCTKEI